MKINNVKVRSAFERRSKVTKESTRNQRLSEVAEIDFQKEIAEAHFRKNFKAHLQYEIRNSTAERDSQKENCGSPILGKMGRWIWNLQSNCGKDHYGHMITEVIFWENWKLHTSNMQLWKWACRKVVAETNKFQAYDATTRRTYKHISECNQALR